MEEQTLLTDNREGWLISPLKELIIRSQCPKIKTRWLFVSARGQNLFSVTSYTLIRLELRWNVYKIGNWVLTASSAFWNILKFAFKKQIENKWINKKWKEVRSKKKIQFGKCKIDLLYCVELEEEFTTRTPSQRMISSPISDSFWFLNMPSVYSAVLNQCTY